MWAVFIVIYNLLPDMCMKESYTFMPLLILDEKSPGCNIDVFLHPLTDEFKVLYSTRSVVTWAGHQQQNFITRACSL